jgi:beta-phosphoglucomutase-like phosphatase (HAD superfamily)
MHWRAWQAIAAKYKLHFPEDRFYSLGGVPSRDILTDARQGAKRHARPH